MKVLIALLFVVSPLIPAAEPPANLLEAKVSFDGNKVRVSDVFEFLGASLKSPPNIVFKGDAGEHEISSLRVKEVTLGNLFRVLETISDVQIQIVEDHGYLKGGTPANHDPFAPAPRNRVLTSSGIVVISSTRPALPPPGLIEIAVRAETPKEELKTEVIQMKDLDFPIESLIEVITTTWRNLDERWVNQGSLAYHEPTKLLIITVPEEGLVIAQKIMGALMPDYQKLLDEKKKNLVRPVLVPGNDLRPMPARKTHPVFPGDPNSPNDILPAKPRALPGTEAVPGSSRAIPLPARPVKPSDPSADPFGN